MTDFSEKRISIQAGFNVAQKQSFEVYTTCRCKIIRFHCENR